MAAPLRSALTRSRARRAPSSSASSSSRYIILKCRHLMTSSPAATATAPMHQPVIPQSLPPAEPDSRLKDAPRGRQKPSSARVLSVGKARGTTRFEASGVRWVGAGGDQQQDPNKAKLGKTLRILQQHLPTLLQSPLPQDILAPNISLRLFPTTHPHLPVVSGKVAYNAALLTSPIAWNRVPIIGNVRLEILAERVTSEPLTFLPRRAGAIPEQLVVRWCEKRRGKDGDHNYSSGNRSANTHNSKDGESSIVKAALPLRSRGGGVDPKKAFTGLFIFDFDADGRILTHTIEQAQEGGDWERGMGAKFVGLTDWLLGGMRDPGDAPIPMFERRRRMD